MPVCRHGESVPLVTTPPPVIGFPCRAIPGPSMVKATSFSDGPSARTLATASEPMKPVSSLQHQPRPASIGPRSTLRSFP
jgi:hypothetical protein